ncbi:uncharacterized protein LOC122084726 [Macadamia integrifolia]|uniref:uncharacterized protein LOC122084726 n=1 Tax=Macadamia integrifolia TaxID=60698 RepID=UPI001C4FFED2|nr:uncharacterized protein LOC122084726 [Macadamia integrifolia]
MPSNVMNMRQRSGEPIWEFLTHFTKATLEVKNLLDGVAYSSLCNGITHPDLVCSLALDLPVTMLDLLQRYNQYANMVDVLEAKGLVEKPKSDKKRAKRPREEDREYKKHKSNCATDQGDAPERYELDRTRTNILMEIQDQKFLYWPRPMVVKPEVRNPNKYYRYHKDHRHDTEDCKALKRGIDELIKAGYLNKYLKQKFGE